MSDRLVCEWNWNKPGPFQAGMRVVVDEAAGTVTFERCHRPRRFWSVRTDAVYTCRLDELLAVHVEWWFAAHPRHGRTAVVSTPHGKATLNSRMAGFEEVVKALREHVGTNRGPVLDNPNVWFAGIVLLAVALSAIGLLWALN